MRSAEVQRNSSIGIVAALLLVTSLVPLAARPRPAGADPVLVPVTCAAVDGMTATGAFRIPIPFLPPIEIPIGSIVQPVVDQISGTELPIPVPVDLTATGEIEPAGTIDLGGSVELDLGDTVGSITDLVRDGIEQAGYPDIADTLHFAVVVEDLEVPFPHPAGTTAAGAPIASGAGVSARTAGGATVVSVDSFEVASEGETSVDAAVEWQLTDGGDPAPRVLTHTMGTVTFDLDIDFGATIPKELLAPFVEVAFPDYADIFDLLAPEQIPVTGGAEGAWACEQDATATTLATTAVTDPDPDPDPVACSTPFVDVGEGHTFCEAIAWGAGTGMIKGWPDGTFRPTVTVSRQAFAAFLHRSEGSPPAGAGAPTFPDVGPDHEFLSAITWLADEGIATGYADGRFGPADPLSRQAIAVMLHRHAGSPAPSGNAPTFPDLPGNPTFATAIRWLAEEGVTTGYEDGTYKPTAPITRQALVAMLQKYLAG